MWHLLWVAPHKTGDYSEHLAEKIKLYLLNSEPEGHQTSSSRPARINIAYLFRCNKYWLTVCHGPDPVQGTKTWTWASSCFSIYLVLPWAPSQNLVYALMCSYIIHMPRFIYLITSQFMCISSWYVTSFWVSMWWAFKKEEPEHESHTHSFLRFISW